MPKTLILFVLLLSGCGYGPETNDNIIKEYKQCKDAGMDAVQNGSGTVTCTVPKVAK